MRVHAIRVSSMQETLFLTEAETFHVFNYAVRNNDGVLASVEVLMGELRSAVRLFIETEAATRIAFIGSGDGGPAGMALNLDSGQWNVTGRRFDPIPPRPRAVRYPASSVRAALSAFLDGKNVLIEIAVGEAMLLRLDSLGLMEVFATGSDLASFSKT